MKKLDKPILLGEMDVYAENQANAKDSEAKPIRIRAIKLHECRLVGNTWVHEIVIEQKDEPDALGNERWKSVALSKLHGQSIIAMITASFEARKELKDANEKLMCVRRALNASPVSQDLDITMDDEITSIITKLTTMKDKINSISNEDIAKAWTGNDVNAVDLESAANVIHMIRERLQ